MGFRTGAWAKIWDIEPKSSTWVKGRISISRKNRQTGEYEQDFSGFVDFTGTACASKAETIQTGDTIKLGDVDVVRVWNKEQQKEYINYKVFSFDFDDSSPRGASPSGVDSNPVDGGEETFLDIPDTETPW